MANLFAEISDIYLTDELIKESKINPKYLVIPMVIFYILDLVIIHDNTIGIFKVDIPILKEFFDIIYNITSSIIYDKFHSQPLAHTIIFGILLILSYKLSDNYKLFDNNDKK